MLDDVAIIDAVRTPGGNMGGTIKDVAPETLASIVIKALIERTKIDPAALSEVIFGQTKICADAPNMGRNASLLAGIPIEVPGYTVSRACGSGMQAIISAAMAIQCGESDMVIAGGTESMSQAVFYLRNARYGYKAGNGVLVDYNTESQVRSQPQDVYGVFNMGITAENVAEKYSISREEQDIFALGSQNKALAAIKEGRFKDEIVPVPVAQKKGDPLMFDTDEFPKESTLEKLAKLKPAFKDGGTVTAGNASGRNDGAAALLLMSAKKAAKEGYKPMAIIRSQGAGGVDPRYMGLGPVPACRKALSKAGLTLDQMDIFELNEAFAAQALGCIKELGIDMNKAVINPNGGAIALGHPLGCSGARIMTTLVHEMKRRNSKYGIASLCIAGGLGLATLVENV